MSKPLHAAPCRILFVCHGNICRSPMAEFIFRDMVAQRGLEGRFEIASCATSTEEIGNSVYPAARAELGKHGLRCDGKRAVQLTRLDYDRYDWLIGMDGQNIRNMLRILGGDPQHKVRKLMDCTPRGGDVADPWYTGAFDVAYRDICDGCKGLLRQILGE